MDEKKKVNFKEELYKEVLYLAKTVVITSVFIYLATNFFVRPVIVDGTSMHPTLVDDDFGFSNVFGSIINNYSRFDVVVIDNKKREELWVKRIIGLPGETIEYRDDILFINNKAIKETYLDKEYIKKVTYDGDLNFTDDFGPITLGKDEYFVMGDNRMSSLDSRMVGPFKENDIVSKSLFVVHPLENFGYITNGGR